MTTIKCSGGQDKEIKFVEVDESKGTLKIFYTDFTFDMYTDVKIHVRG
jgi:hypothetical protein